jgi:hypothetical protein
MSAWKNGHDANGRVWTGVERDAVNVRLGPMQNAQREVLPGSEPVDLGRSRDHPSRGPRPACRHRLAQILRRARCGNLVAVDERRRQDRADRQARPRQAQRGRSARRCREGVGPRHQGCRGRL